MCRTCLDKQRGERWVQFGLQAPWTARVELVLEVLLGKGRCWAHTVCSQPGNSVSKIKKQANAFTPSIYSVLWTSHRVFCSIFTSYQKKPRNRKAKPSTLGSSDQNPNPLGVKVTLWSCSPINLCQGVCKTWLLNNSHLSMKGSCPFDGKQIAGLSDLAFATWIFVLVVRQFFAWHFRQLK